MSIMYSPLNLLRAAAAVAGAALLASAHAAPTAAAIGALSQPAVADARSVNAAMLAVARAGERLVAVGERGVILLSDDSGKSWRQASVPVRTSLTAVQFVDASHGWAVGHMGVVLCTVDGGHSWSKQLDGLAIARVYQQALDAAPESARGADEKEYARMLVEDGPDKPLLSLAFSDRQRGIVVGAYNMALQTSDGGASWQVFGQHLPNPRRLHFYKVLRQDQQVVLVGEQGLMLSSANGGADFTTLATPYKGSWFGLLGGTDGAWTAYGLRGMAWRSTDQGGSWNNLNTGAGGSIVGALTLADGRLLLASQTGELLLRAEGGSGFKRLGAQLGAPVADVAQAPDGSVIAATLRGPVRVSMNPSSARQ
jgi:photosystem II stability/assembly factor-like uncharacterized protein